ncbi:glycosyltransferase family protein [soil metagenome]
MNIVIVCQTRVGSTRLPGKTLLPLAGRPLVIRFMERVMRSNYATSCVVAATTEPSDDVLVTRCLEQGLHVFQGHPTDLLDRHYRTGIAYNADVVVKIPSDCPLIDPLIIDRVIRQFLDHKGNVDYVSNLHPASYPDGNDVEVMTMEALERAWLHATKPHEREHTTPWLWDANPAIRIGNHVWESGRDLSMTHRWTVDYPEDYMFVRAVYDQLYTTNPMFGLEEVLDLVERHEEIEALNRHLAGVNWYRSYIGELATITTDDTRVYPGSSNGSEAA